MKDFDAAVGATLRSLRDRAGLTALDMVERTGIPGSDLASYEAGMAIPSSDLRAISSALGLGLPSVLGHVYPLSTSAEASAATAEEGYELILRFRQISDARSRRFLTDMAHALGDREFNPDH